MHFDWTLVAFIINQLFDYAAIGKIFDIKKYNMLYIAYWLQSSRFETNVLAALLLLLSLRNFLEVKEYICDMTGCGIKFQSSSKLSRHKRVVHTRTASVQCDVCHRIFSRSDHLNTHRASQHSSVSEKVLRCLVHTCEKRYRKWLFIFKHLQ